MKVNFFQMSQKQKWLLFLLVFSYCPLSFSQVGQVKEDSSAVYKDIQTYSKKNKFTKLLHKLIFEPVNVKRKKKRVLPRIQQKFEGKNHSEYNNRNTRSVRIF
jgi:hypothetical protein